MSHAIRVAALVAASLFCTPAPAQVQRSFVASFGSDTNTVNNCVLSAPCRSFNAAQSITNSGGEIVALDAAGYGSVTITKSINILANPGFYAGISAGSGSAVTIATAGVDVRLSGLKINGIGATTGISMTDGTSLLVENCTISGFSGIGIDVVANAKVRIVDTLVTKNASHGIHLGNGTRSDVTNTKALGNGGSGFQVDNTNGTTTIASISNSVSSGNFCGILTRADGSSLASNASATVTNMSNDNNAYAGFYSGTLGANATSTLAVAGSKSSFNSNGFIVSGTNSFLLSGGNNFVESNTNDMVAAGGGVISTPGLK